MIRITRRAFGATAFLAAPALAQSIPVLRIGNQKGGLRSLLEASGVGQDLPYRIEWSEFPAAAPLLEALNAGALDLGYQGDLAFLTVFASGAGLQAARAGSSPAARIAVIFTWEAPAALLTAM